MKLWVKVAVGAAGIVGLSAATIALAENLWTRETKRCITRLDGNVSSIDTQYFSSEDIADLPTCVQRYFKYALTPGQPLIRRARAIQSGAFRMGGIETPWLPLTSTQHFTADPPGFVWDASIRMAPGLNVRVRDSYNGGEGTMEGSIASLFPVVNQKGTPELASGALHRYLSEAVWLPTALLPCNGIIWEPLDENSALATLTSDGITVSLEFQFGESGEIIRSYTAGRFREVNGLTEPTPCACHYRNYQRLNGMMLPRNGEVEWILPEGALPYCQIELLDIEFQSI